MPLIDDHASRGPAAPGPDIAPVEILGLGSWAGEAAPADRERALAALEGGKVVFLPDLAFPVGDRERRFLDPSAADGTRKNVSFDPRTRAVGGTALEGPDREDLARLLDRFGTTAQGLLAGLFPGYAAHLERGRASLRPVGIDDRAMSPRKDDRRLHVDAFPSSPVQGRRILRVFSNVSPDGAARLWHVGEPFADYARRFLPRHLWPLPPGAAALQRVLGITKGRRTEYDRVMLRLHDRAKEDGAYQTGGRRDAVHFPAGSSWIVYTDMVPHAALAGRNALEQTFYLPIAAMRDPEATPLRILERMTGRRLA